MSPDRGKPGALRRELHCLLAEASVQHRGPDLTQTVSARAVTSASADACSYANRQVDYRALGPCTRDRLGGSVALAVVDRRILIVPDVAAQPSCYIHAERPPQCERAIVVDLASSRQLSAGVIVAFRGAGMRRHVCERGWGRTWRGDDRVLPPGELSLREVMDHHIPFA